MRCLKVGGLLNYITNAVVMCLKKMLKSKKWLNQHRPIFAKLCKVIYMP